MALPALLAACLRGLVAILRWLVARRSRVKRMACTSEWVGLELRVRCAVLAPTRRFHENGLSYLIHALSCATVYVYAALDNGVHFYGAHACAQACPATLLLGLAALAAVRCLPWGDMPSQAFCPVTVAAPTAFSPSCFLGAAFLMWELSTPFVYVRWVLLKLGMAESRLLAANNLLGFAVFFCCRNLYGPCERAVVLLLGRQAGRSHLTMGMDRHALPCLPLPALPCPGPQLGPSSRPRPCPCLHPGADMFWDFWVASGADIVAPRPGGFSPRMLYLFRALCGVLNTCVQGLSIGFAEPNGRHCCVGQAAGAQPQDSTSPAADPCYWLCSCAGSTMCG